MTNSLVEPTQSSRSLTPGLFNLVVSDLLLSLVVVSELNLCFPLNPLVGDSLLLRAWVSRKVVCSCHNHRSVSPFTSLHVLFHWNCLFQRIPLSLILTSLKFCSVLLQFFLKWRLSKKLFLRKLLLWAFWLESYFNFCSSKFIFSKLLGLKKRTVIFLASFVIAFLWIFWNTIDLIFFRR